MTSARSSLGPANPGDASLIGTLLPPMAASAETLGGILEGTLLPEEEQDLGAVVPARRREFTAGRVLARRALLRLGVAPGPILQGAHREPLWPDTVVGSITHCPGYCAAVVAHRSRVAALGIDAEPHEPLPAEVIPMVVRSAERDWCDARNDDTTHWERVLFSVKECVFKAVFPLTGFWLGFDDIHVEVGAVGTSFQASLLVPGLDVNGRRLTELEGRYLVARNLVIATVVLTPEGGSTRPHGVDTL
jgi:4'-phosphopantetheinyl transferase EntD